MARLTVRLLVLQDDYQYLAADDQDTGREPVSNLKLKLLMAVAEFFDVKFYPYGDDSHDPVFAAVSKKHVRLPYTYRRKSDA